MFDADKTRIIVLPDGQTDRQTDRILISISRVNMLTRDKNKTIMNAGEDVSHKQG